MERLPPRSDALLPFRSLVVGEPDGGYSCAFAYLDVFSMRPTLLILFIVLDEVSV